MTNPPFKHKYKYYWYFFIGIYADASWRPLVQYGNSKNDDDLPARWLNIEFMKIRIDGCIEKVIDMNHYFKQFSRG